MVWLVICILIDCCSFVISLRKCTEAFEATLIGLLLELSSELGSGTKTNLPDSTPDFANPYHHSNGTRLTMFISLFISQADPFWLEWPADSKSEIDQFKFRVKNCIREIGD